MLLLLLIVGALATPAPVNPTPYPTYPSDPDPTSKCDYDDDQDGPFSLACKQQRWIANGCSVRGTGYPASTNDEYGYDVETWKNYGDRVTALKANSDVLCLGAATDSPTNEPTPSPTTLRPTNPPTYQPTAIATDAKPSHLPMTVLKNVAANAAYSQADFKADCDAAKYNVQDDNTKYVVRVKRGSATTYATTADGDNVCTLAQGTLKTGRGIAGPFGPSSQAIDIFGTHSEATEIAIGPIQNNADCQEIIVPFDKLDNPGTLRPSYCAATTYTNANKCGGGFDKEIALGIANGLLDGTCDGTTVYNLDTSKSFSWNASGSCWNQDGASNPSAYVTGQKDNLCVQRCDYTNFHYDANGEKCWSRTAAGTAAAGKAACEAAGAKLASVRDNGENAYVNALSEGNAAYLGNDASATGTAGANWQDGNRVDYTNYKGDSEANAGFEAGAKTQLSSGTDGWTFSDGSASQRSICSKASNENYDARGRTAAADCITLNQDLLNGENQRPEFVQANSGFNDASKPNHLALQLAVYKTNYDIEIWFKGATNDLASYSTNNEGQWTKVADGDCSQKNTLTLDVAWTDFNRGDAGHVIRRDSGLTKQSDESTVDTGADGSKGEDDHHYLFLFSIKYRAKRDLTYEHTNDTHGYTKQLSITRQILHTIPLALRFQKTISVTTNSDLVSTKFNYKTVAALIQSIQSDTQYFTPPYAKITVQIRTKSQYPYMFNKDPSEHKAFIGQENDANPQADVVLDWIADDANCTFTNSDHMREGDICTQEWKMSVTPNDNVCYATGEYTLVLGAHCFYGKSVCQMPYDSNGDPIETVTFRFKIQTSRFCPTVADEVDLTGELTITGRESFKPAAESLEGNTVGSSYFQGDTVHAFIQVDSKKAVITNTEVLRIEAKQNTDNLIRTGFYRVPFDAKQAHFVVWEREVNGNQLADGEITLSAYGSSDIQVRVMSDSDVYSSGHDFGGYQFSAKEAGFKLTLNGKVFPVNLDSSDQKELLVTVQITWEGIGTQGRRRRLLSLGSENMVVGTNANLKAWAPKQMPSGLHTVASMEMAMSVQAGTVSRANAHKFAASFKQAIISGLMKDRSSSRTIYDEQVSVDNIWSNNVKIWTKAQRQGFGEERRLLSGNAQTLKIHFTFADVPYKNAIELHSMIKMFESQIKRPASPLNQEPIFRTSVIHELKEIATGSYKPPLAPGSTRLESGASLPSIMAALICMLFALA